MSLRPSLPHPSFGVHRRVYSCTIAALVVVSLFCAPIASAKAVRPVPVAAVRPVQTATTTTTLPPPRSAGTPIRNWPSVTPQDWPEPGNAMVVHPRGRSVEVHQSPDREVGKLRFDNGGATYGQVTFLLLEDNGDWLRVALPMRPNGTAGWVRRSDVTVERVRERIVVELDSNTLTLERDGVAVLVERIAAGTGGTPTPKGLFFVKEIVPQGNPNGALGPFALGLSGYSEVLYSFAGGNGVIGIHGTNAPGKLGSDVSHGCIRISNSAIASLARIIPLGTPVEIANRRADVPNHRRTAAPSPQAEPDSTSSADAPPAASPAPTTTTPTTTTPTTTTPTTTTPTTTTPSATASTVPAPLATTVPTVGPTAAPLPLGTLPNAGGPPH